MTLSELAPLCLWPLALYVALATACNVSSIVYKKLTGYYLTSVQPTQGLIVVLIYAFAIWLSRTGNVWPKVALALLTAGIAYGGIYRHWGRNDALEYTHKGARRLAMTVNALGVIASSIFLTSF